MTPRIIVGLVPKADWKLVKQQLTASGADPVRDPSPELPDVAVVIPPSGTDIDAFARSVQKIPGVRYAEVEAWRMTS